MSDPNSFSVLSQEIQDLYKPIDAQKPQDYFSLISQFLTRQAKLTNKQLGSWIDNVKLESKNHKAVKDFVRKGKTKDVLLSIMADFLVRCKMCTLCMSDLFY